jgi:pyruvate dehydrogenase E2 component (dihydrolipoamide acetyltransferase)
VPIPRLFFVFKERYCIFASPLPFHDSTHMAHHYKLPSLGDGVTGKVIDILVKPGDVVEKEQIVLIVGTDKVDAEMPVDAAGVVEAVLVKKGDDVTEGMPILDLKILEGMDEPTRQVPAVKVPAVAVAERVATNTVATAAAPTVAGGLRISPLARKRAREFGIDIQSVQSAVGNNRLSYKDVLDYVRRQMEVGGSTSVGAKQLPNFDKYGATKREPQSRIGILTADNMVYAFNAIPHAWISEKADITRLEQLRQQHKDQVKAVGGNLTTTAILAKAVAIVLRKMPQFNASYDLENREIIFKQYYNIGIAVDTPRGLLVPVLHGVDQKNLTEISVELAEISGRTRDGKNKPEDLEGGTFTLSNIGATGGTNMHSVVNWPQVAILSVVAANLEPVWNGTAFEPRLMMPMTIGWDHRVINGGDAARFLVALKKILEEPFVALL